MAHECPECGCTCHCGGDIDDICLPNRHYEARCTCCPYPFDEEDNSEDDYERWCLEQDEADRE